MGDRWLDPALVEATTTAVNQVEAWIATLGFRRLDAEELAVYGSAVGWRIPLGTGDDVHEADLVLPPTFPWSAPRVVLVNPPPFPSSPHVERNGSLCVLASNAEWDTTKPLALVQRVLQGAIDVLEAGRQGTNTADFRDEVRSYWEVRKGEKEVRSLLVPAGPSRGITLWRGKDFTLAGEDSQVMDDWLAHRFPGSRRKWTHTRGLLCWLPEAPIPAEYPDSVERLLDHITRAGLIELVPKLIGAAGDRFSVLFGFPAAEGTAFLAVEVQPSRAGQKRGALPVQQWLADGFRGNKVPAALVSARFLNRAQVARQDVQRVDAWWVHGRDANDDVDVLRIAQVVVVGCGSLGSNVARLLAQAGVGSFIFVDPEKLTSANTSRHVLGSASVDQGKASELAKRLEQDFPHVFDSKVIVGGWEDAVRRDVRLFDEADLVISTVASWRKESLLDRWLLGRKKASVVYGWAEPHAAAGQAVLIDHRLKDGCLACGMTSAGQPRLEVTRWIDPTIRQEPACGAFFQPYGAIQLDSVARLVAELSLDALLERAPNRTHRIWAASQRTLTVAGGAWSAEWLALVAGDQNGAREIEVAWPRAQSCVCVGAS